MTPEERRAADDQMGVQPIRRSPTDETPVSLAADPEGLRRQIRQTRNDMGETIQDIERQLDGDRLKARAEEIADHLKARAEEVADHVIQEATERAKLVVLEATDHAKEAAKEITDHALSEAKVTVREVTGQASAAAREATIGKVENMVQNASQRAGGLGSDVVDVITRNPMAATLAGLGLGWLLLGNRSSSGTATTSGRSYYYGRGAYSTGRPTWSSTHEQTPSLGERVGEKFEDAQNSARGALDQVQETAGDVAGQAQEFARDAGDAASDVGSTLLDTIQRNPVPSLLAAASVGYLFLNRPGTGTPAPVYDARNRAERAAGQLRESTDQLASDVQDTAGELADRVQETTGRVASQAQDTFEEVGNTLQYQATRTQYRLEELFSNSPLIVGAAALALGALVGLPVPQTRQEHELMGQASSRVIDHAQSVAQETVQKVQDTAQKVQQVVENPGQDEELRKRAQEVADQAEQVAQKLTRPA